MGSESVVIVGGGIGGLCAAVDLARRGVGVTVVERAPSVGGKMREVAVDGIGVDAGPTVFTMRGIFDDLFEAAGSRLDAHLDLQPLAVLARHGWDDGTRLDLFADRDRSVEAIGDFAGSRAARGYRDFCIRTARIYRTLAGPFIASERPSIPALVRRVGPLRIDAQLRILPWPNLWTALGRDFQDDRLRQLFARYSTYVGSSPLQTPATLMLVAHVEQAGVWRVVGGMKRTAEALQTLGEQLGVTYRLETEVHRIEAPAGQVRGVVLADGERLSADAVVFNGDTAALANGRLGPDVTRASGPTPRAKRALSAVTWCLRGQPSGFPLHHHTVFFSRRQAYPEEFRAIFRDRRISQAPTVYLCAQDRDVTGERRPRDATEPPGERLLALINAPPDGDRQSFDHATVAELQGRAFDLLRACGLELQPATDGAVVTAPDRFHQLFPETGGALYGRATHGTLASFERPGARARLPGLYLAGGSAHPGPGVPMAALSGRLAAARLLADWEEGAGRPVSVPVPF